jgi:hypothetical protein
MKKIFTYLIALSFLPMLMMAQEREIKEEGKKSLNLIATCNSRVVLPTHWVRQILWT